jgi:hypothetical protein
MSISQPQAFQSCRDGSVTSRTDAPSLPSIAQAPFGLSRPQPYWAREPDQAAPRGLGPLEQCPKGEISAWLDLVPQASCD